MAINTSNEERIERRSERQTESYLIGDFPMTKIQVHRAHGKWSYFLSIPIKSPRVASHRYFQIWSSLLFETRKPGRVLFLSPGVKSFAYVTKKIAESIETKAVGFLSCDSWRNSPTRRLIAWTLLTRTAREYPTWRAFGANPGVKLLFTVRRLGVSIGKSALVNRSTNKRPVHFTEERSQDRRGKFDGRLSPP